MTSLFLSSDTTPLTTLHCDRLHPYEPAQKIRISARNLNEALTFAINDLTDNWKNYRRRYELWIEGV